MQNEKEKRIEKQDTNSKVKQQPHVRREGCA